MITVDQQQGYEQVRGTDFGPPGKGRWKWWVAGGVVVIGAALAGTAYWFQNYGPFSIKGGKIIVRDTKGGALEIDTAPKLPDGFPSDIPVYTEARLTSSAVLKESKDPQAQGSLYVWMAPAPLEDVAFWYIRELERRGWNIKNKTASGNSVLFTVIKDGRGFILTLTGISSERTDVSLVFDKEF